MEIKLKEFEKDSPVEIKGKFLVKTVSTSHLKTIQYLQARVTSNWNVKRNIFEVSVDVANQKVTHISIEPLIF